MQQSVRAQIGAFLGGLMQRRPSLWIGGIDRILKPLQLLPVCSETLAAVIGSGFLRVFPAPPIVVRIVKVLDRNTARPMTCLEVRSGFEQPVHHVLPLVGIGHMQWNLSFVIRNVRIGSMIEKRLAALGPTFLDRNPQRSPPGLIPRVGIGSGFDQTDDHGLVSRFRGVMQGSGAAVIARAHIRPRLDQEMGPSCGRVVRRPMQGSGAFFVLGVDVGPGPNQGARYIQVGIPDGRPMQWRLTPKITHIRIGPTLE